MFGTATPFIASYVIVRKNGKIAFVLRGNTNWMNDHYGLPSGKTEKGESFSAGAIREALEEIGITVKPDDLRFVHVMHRNEGLEWVDVYFEALDWKGKAYNAEPHMHSKLSWLDPAKLPSNVIPSVKFALEQIELGNVYSEYGW
jgi:8-oxo-dGTP pyrophosphatase MutT (NUDIX family)